tara:strand:+ start:9159 stop:9518 length:360 start_codon:yes stop_codon:yes gene_type:complete
MSQNFYNKEWEARKARPNNNRIKKLVEKKKQNEQKKKKEKSNSTLPKTGPASTKTGSHGRGRKKKRRKTGKGGRQGDRLQKVVQSTTNVTRTSNTNFEFDGTMQKTYHKVFTSPVNKEQ